MSVSITFCLNSSNKYNNNKITCGGEKPAARTVQRETQGQTHTHEYFMTHSGHMWTHTCSNKHGGRTSHVHGTAARHPHASTQGASRISGIIRSSVRQRHPHTCIHTHARPSVRPSSPVYRRRSAGAARRVAAAAGSRCSLHPRRSAVAHMQRLLPAEPDGSHTGGVFWTHGRDPRQRTASPSGEPRAGG